MPTDNVKIAGGTLYFGNPETGEILGAINNVEEVKLEVDDQGVDPEKFHLGGEATFTCDCEIDRNTALSLVYGRWVTNNWLKMHGGVIKRKKRRRNHG